MKLWNKCAVCGQRTTSKKYRNGVVVCMRCAK